MKKAGLIALSGVLLLLLTGCGSKASRSVDSLIGAIGQVDADCGPVVEYVRNEYEQLSPQDREQVKQYDLLLAAEAAYVDALIDAISPVTPDSMPRIEAAQKAYAALNPEAKALVAGMEALQKLEEECTYQTIYASVSGTWVNELLGSRNTRIGKGLVHSFGLDETDCNPVSAEAAAFELKEAGEVSYAQEHWGTWTLSEDWSQVILQGDGIRYVLQILQEDGFTKLVGAVFDNQPFGYVQESDYLPAFQAKYAVVSLNRSNIHSYIGDPVLIGTWNPENWLTYNIYHYPSHAFAQGLVYVGAACNFQVDYAYGGKSRHIFQESPTVSVTTAQMRDARINTEARISGEVYYIKAAYVSDNSINEDGFRVLELTNGVRMVFNGYEDSAAACWSRVDVPYSDYIY